jgi:hypothetical protein
VRVCAATAWPARSTRTRVRAVRRAVTRSHTHRHTRTHKIWFAVAAQRKQKKNGTMQHRFSKIKNPEERKKAEAKYDAKIGSKPGRLAAVAASKSRSAMAEKRGLWGDGNPGKLLPRDSKVNEWIVSQGGIVAAREKAVAAPH